MYCCSTATDVLDEESTTFGIRTLALDPERGLRINGEPVLLRGACVHHDNGVIGAATIDRAEERRVELLRAAGFNAIRSAHHPMSKAMLAACDRVGMLVMDETFDMWLQTKSDDDYALRFADWWEADVEAMVRKDVNHPSVILYSIGNEVPDGSTPVGVQLARAQADKVRALDDTRFVTQAVTGMLIAGPELFDEIRDAATATGVNEETEVNTAATNLGDIMGMAMLSPVVTAKTTEAFSHLDVAGYNYMATRFEPDGDRFPQRVIVSTESHPPSIDRDWAAVLRHPYVIGDFTWTGWDYLGEAGVGRTEYGDERAALGMSAFLGEYPWRAAWCADLDITGHRLPQSYYREIVFGLRTDPYVAVRRPEHHGRTVVHQSPWAWNDVVSSWSWAGHEGAPVTVEVYADADEVELLLDGRSLGRGPAGAANRFRAEFETTYEPGVLEAVAWRDGKEVGRTSLRSAAGPGGARRPRRPRRDQRGSHRSRVRHAHARRRGRVAVQHRRIGRSRSRSTVRVSCKVWAVRTRAPRRDSPNLPAGRSTAEPSRSCARPVPAPSRSPQPRRDANRSRSASMPGPDRGRATQMTWELRWHPFRAEWVLFTAHRGARPWIGETVADDEAPVPADNALAPLGRRIDTTNPDYRGVFVFTNDLPVFSPDAPEPPERRRPVPHATRGRHRRGRLLPPRPEPLDGRPRRRRGERGRHHLAGAHPRAAVAATASRTC